jgi:hypothetical protein
MDEDIRCSRSNLNYIFNFNNCIFFSIIDDYCDQVVTSAKSRSYNLVYQKLPQHEIWTAYRGGTFLDKLKGHTGKVDDILKSKFSKEIESNYSKLIGSDLTLLHECKKNYISKMQFDEYVSAKKKNLQTKFWEKSDVAALMIKTKVNFTDWFSATIFLDSKLPSGYKGL